MNKKILIATGIFPPDIGGPAVMLEALARGLVNSGFKVQIMTYSEKDPKQAYNNSPEFDIRRIRKGLPFGLSRLAYFIRLILLSNRADVIYITDTYSVGYFAHIIKKMFKKKYILRFTGDSAWEKAGARGWTTDNLEDFQDKKYGTQVEKLKSQRKKILLNADALIVDSEFNKKIALKIGVNENKIYVIPNISHLPENIEEKKVQKIKDKYGRIILFSGRLMPWKGLEALIKIMPRLMENVEAGDQLTLLILGDGPEENNLKELTRQIKVGENVSFLGRIAHSETINYFAAADVFVLNSQYEGCSHAILDALKIGLPVVASNAGGNAELIRSGENGLLVEYNNLEQLNRAISKILIDKNLTQKIINQAKHAIQKFNWQEAIKKTVEIIEKL